MSIIALIKDSAMTAAAQTEGSIVKTVNFGVR